MSGWNISLTEIILGDKIYIDPKSCWGKYIELESRKEKIRFAYSNWNHVGIKYQTENMSGWYICWIEIMSEIKYAQTKIISGWNLFWTDIMSEWNILKLKSCRVKILNWKHVRMKYMSNWNHVRNKYTQTEIMSDINGVVELTIL